MERAVDCILRIMESNKKEFDKQLKSALELD
jgi:hypothetical protein